jgi:hypothetical protein
MGSSPEMFRLREQHAMATPNNMFSNNYGGGNMSFPDVGLPPVGMPNHLAISEFSPLPTVFPFFPSFNPNVSSASTPQTLSTPCLATTSTTMMTVDEKSLMSASTSNSNSLFSTDNHTTTEPPSIADQLQHNHQWTPDETKILLFLGERCAPVLNQFFLRTLNITLKCVEDCPTFFSSLSAMLGAFNTEEIGAINSVLNNDLKTVESPTEITSYNAMHTSPEASIEKVTSTSVSDWSNTPDSTSSSSPILPADNDTSLDQKNETRCRENAMKDDKAVIQIAKRQRLDHAKNVHGLSYAENAFLFLTKWGHLRPTSDYSHCKLNQIYSIYCDLHRVLPLVYLSIANDGSPNVAVQYTIHKDMSRFWSLMFKLCVVISRRIGVHIQSDDIKLRSDLIAIVLRLQTHDVYRVAALRWVTTRLIPEQSQNNNQQTTFYEDGLALLSQLSGKCTFPTCVESQHQMCDECMTWSDEIIHDNHLENDTYDSNTIDTDDILKKMSVDDIEHELITLPPFLHQGLYLETHANSKNTVSLTLEMFQETTGFPPCVYNGITTVLLSSHIVANDT